MQNISSSPPQDDTRTQTCNIFTQRVSLFMNNYETNRKAFEISYDEYFDQIFYFLASRINDRERAKELAQETFMKTWKYIVEGNKVTNMRPFLYTTAYNLFKNELRRKREIVSLETAFENFGFQPTDESMLQDRRSELVLLTERVQDLDEPYRKALTLRYVDGLAVQEIAHLLDETPTTISVRIHRGLTKLRNTYAYGTRNKKTAY